MREAIGGARPVPSVEELVVRAEEAISSADRGAAPSLIFTLVNLRKVRKYEQGDLWGRAWPSARSRTSRTRASALTGYVTS